MCESKLPEMNRVTFGKYASNGMDSPTSGVFDFWQKVEEGFPKSEELEGLRVFVKDGLVTSITSWASDKDRPVTDREREFALGLIYGCQFKLIEFNQVRYMRNADAARVDCGGGQWLWMNVEDLNGNIEEFGAHPDLVKALSFYGEDVSMYEVKADA